MSDNILLVSDIMIKERTAVHGKLEPNLIFPDIKVAQDMYILPLLGTALFNKMQSLIAAGTISDPVNVNYKLLLDKYLADALIYYTLSELPSTISFQFWNKGVGQKIGQDSQPATMSDLIDLSNKYKNRAEFYAQRARLFIITNANAMFPEYIMPGSSIDTITPEQRSFTMPVYLGDDYNPWCNRGGFNGQPYKD